MKARVIVGAGWLLVAFLFWCLGRSAAHGDRMAARRREPR